MKNILREKAVSTVRILSEIEQADSHLRRIIDINSINKLYDEKTLIFNADYQLIYGNIDDAAIQWSREDLDYLKEHHEFFRIEKDHEVYGYYSDSNNKEFYTLVSARDNIGKRKLAYLLQILIITYVIFTALAWVITYTMLKKLLAPLDVFHTKIKSINEQNLDTRIAVKVQKDEIDLLADEFNQMLDRIAGSYKRQQEFTSNASHELRTPLARLILQLENRIQDPENRPAENSFYQSILNDVNQLNQLTDSLLLLSKNENNAVSYTETCRIDEIIFEAATNLTRQFPDFKLDLGFENVTTLEITGNKSLLLIAFQNLLKNAYLYSRSKQVVVQLYSDEDILKVSVINDGDTLSVPEQNQLFEPFMRGENARRNTGLGLGLRIVHRILTNHIAKVSYHISEEKKNVFTIVLQLVKSE